MSPTTIFSPAEADDQEGRRVNLSGSTANYDTHDVTLLKGAEGREAQQFTSTTGTTRASTSSATFTSPGKYHFVCTIHPGTMDITVIVKK